MYVRNTDTTDSKHEQCGVHDTTRWLQRHCIAVTSYYTVLDYVVVVFIGPCDLLLLFSHINLPDHEKEVLGHRKGSKKLWSGIIPQGKIIH